MYFRMDLTLSTRRSTFGKPSVTSFISTSVLNLSAFGELVSRSTIFPIMSKLPTADGFVSLPLGHSIETSAGIGFCAFALLLANIDAKIYHDSPIKKQIDHSGRRTVQLTLGRLHYFRRRLKTGILRLFGHELFLHFHNVVHCIRAFWPLNHFEIVLFSLNGFVNKHANELFTPCRRRRSVF